MHTNIITEWCLASSTSDTTERWSRGDRASMWSLDLHQRADYSCVSFPVRWGIVSCSRHSSCNSARSPSVSTHLLLPQTLRTNKNRLISAIVVCPLYIWVLLVQCQWFRLSNTLRNQKHSDCDTCHRMCCRLQEGNKDLWEADANASELVAS